MHDLSGRIAVLGLGRSGTAVVQWALARHDHGPDDVRVFVEHDTPAMQEAAEPFRRLGVVIDFGSERLPDESFAFVVASPGIAPWRPIMRSAASLGVPVISELELAYRVAQAPIVAVTGTNGKTTVTSLVAHLLNTAGHGAVAAGNIGAPALDAARSAPASSTIVAECSSFQLALTQSFHPRVAVLLNITPDHIDWHGSVEAYASDKAKIFTNLEAGDTAVIDIDDPGSARWVEAAASSGAAVLRVSRMGEAEARLRDEMLVVEHGGSAVDLVTIDELLIRGTHNVSNALAAAAAALATGADAESVREGLRTFAPIEHRLEPVGTIAGVRYVNDSKATNPDAVLKALTAFGDDPLILLLGGRNKGNAFDDLAAACAERCKLAVLYGEARPELQGAFDSAGAACVLAVDMRQALDIARGAAVAGDVIVLSPACASFDAFTGYEQRGRVFTEAVTDMAEGER